MVLNSLERRKERDRPGGAVNMRSSKGWRDIRSPDTMVGAGTRRQVVGLFPPFRLFMSVFCPSYKKGNKHIENGCLPWTTFLKLGFV